MSWTISIPVKVPSPGNGFYVEATFTSNGGQTFFYSGNLPDLTAASTATFISAAQNALKAWQSAESTETTAQNAIASSLNATGQN